MSEIDNTRGIESVPNAIDFPEIVEEAVEVWDEISDWWDDEFGDGNTAQDFLIEPTQERLLDLKTGEPDRIATFNAR